MRSVVSRETMGGMDAREGGRRSGGSGTRVCVFLSLVSVDRACRRGGRRVRTGTGDARSRARVGSGWESPIHSSATASVGFRRRSFGSSGVGERACESGDAW